jgi:ubiquinone/menaquinone biosynthesis C-methylase UbiE
MNENHETLCSSSEWAEYLQRDVLDRVIGSRTIGREMLEIGPGPGAATEWLRSRVERLVVVELDARRAAQLESRFAGTNVEVVVGDAQSLGFDDQSFDAVGCFTMLHHVAALATQRAILSEVRRVLRPGGVLVGSDSLASVALHEFHAGDAYNPIDPAVLLVVLRSLGFAHISVDVDEILTFVASMPESSASDSKNDTYANQEMVVTR